MILSEKELSSISGGSKWVVGGIMSTIIAFLIGGLDGYFRPLSCKLCLKRS